MKARPWFMGSTGLFMTPWFPEFDPNTMVLSRMSVWVCLHNLPLHFWSPQVLFGIGNTIGRFIKMDTKRTKEGIYTFACMCVEVDLSKALPDQIHLKYKQRCWTQILDYENTAFRCKICRQIGHLQNTCLEAKKDTRRKKKVGKQPKGWQFPPPDADDVPVEEEDKEKEHPIPKENNQTHKEPDPEEFVTHDLMDSLPGKIPGTMDISGAKRHHTSDHSNSDKDNPRPLEDTSLTQFSSLPTQGEWRKEKKGRKI